MIEKLFSNQVVALKATPKMWGGLLYPEEEEYIKKAVPKRRREFTAGRLCAREVLSRLGIKHFPLLVGPHRSPIWPENVVGSISHCRNLCLVVATKNSGIKGLGIDVEQAGQLEQSVIELVCTAQERKWLADAPSYTGTNSAKIIFSAKESFYKSVSSIIQPALEFWDIQISINNRQNCFQIKLHNIQAAKALEKYFLAGRYHITEDFVFTGVEVREKGLI